MAVWQSHRGRGIGRRLLEELERTGEDGVAQLSLSVDVDNSARRLYERLGYEELTVDDEGVRMVKRL